jgi:hypothetical protein
MRTQRWIGLLLFAGFAPLAAALDTSATAPSASVPGAAQITNLQGLTITGVQPGPGLWKVSKGDHVLWVLGTLNELPKGLRWQARDVQSAIGDAQQLLQPPQMSMNAKLGFFGKLALLPSLIGLRNNPDGKRLVEMVSPADYARWLVLKAKYLGRDRGVEKQRPIFAAFALYEAAIKQAGLADDVIEPVILDAARQSKLTPTPVNYVVTVAQPRAALKDFKRGPLDDGTCFVKTLDHLEADVALMHARANAWATGDLDALRTLPLGDQYQVCVAAVSESGIAHELGFTDMKAKIEDTWVAAAAKALDSNRVTFAELPMSRLLGSDSYLVKLQAQGCTVALPDGLSDDAPGPLAHP